MPWRSACVFCVPDQTVTPSSRTSTTEQPGPMLACDWNGQKYDASSGAFPIVASTSPFLTVLSLIAGWAHMKSASLACAGSVTAGCVQVVFSARAARTASHSRVATTPAKPATRITRASPMPWIDDSSTLTSVAPMLGG